MEVPLAHHRVLPVLGLADGRASQNSVEGFWVLSSVLRVWGLTVGGLGPQGGVYGDEAFTVLFLFREFGA